MDQENAPRPQLVHGNEPGEWCVTLDGQRVVTFSGPNAREAAERHRDELDSLVTKTATPLDGEAADERLGG